MSQVGRISGPLLFANLERNGIDLAFETDLLYLDVNNGKIGIRNNAPTNDLHVLDTTRTTALYGDTQADIANINFQNSTCFSQKSTLAGWLAAGWQAADQPASQGLEKIEIFKTPRVFFKTFKNFSKLSKLNVFFSKVYFGWLAGRWLAGG